jgi:ATP-dependent RNA helicase DeaD
VKLGQQDGVDEAMLREAVAALAPGTEVIAVEVRQTHGFVEVPPEAVEGVVAALNGKEWAGKRIAAERARRRRR